MGIWYLLFSGTSEDGLGEGHFSGRTTHKKQAFEHFKKGLNNPYWIGRVEIINDFNCRRATEKDFVDCLQQEAIGSE